MLLEEILRYVQFVKYEVIQLTIVLPDTEIEIVPTFISEMTLEYDYDNLYTPMFSVSVALSQEEYRQIVTHKDSVQFILRINKTFYDDEKNMLHYEPFISDTFCSHIIDETPLMEQDLTEMTRDIYNADPDDKIPMDLKNVRDFWLFKDEHISAGNRDVNMVIRRGSVNDIVVHLLSQAGLNNVLMTPSNNNSTITNLLFPLMTTVKALDYLHEIKGIYNKGVMFFMDYDTTYFIDKNAYCTAWRPNEYRTTNIYVFSQKSQFNSVIGQFGDPETEQINIFTNSDSIDITNKSLINNAIYGNRMLLLHSKRDSVSSLNPNLIQRGDSNTVVNIQKNGNRYLRNSDNTRLIENEYSVKIILKDVDLTSLTPNKCFKIIFQNVELNEKYGGTYRISRMLTTFRKIGEELDSDTICELKKQNSNTNEFGGEDYFDDWTDYDDEPHHIPIPLFNEGMNTVDPSYNFIRNPDNNVDDNLKRR